MLNEKVVIVDYGVGNLRSVGKAFESLGANVEISSSPDALRSAGRLVLPGVGAFDVGINNLKNKGQVEVLRTEVLEKGKPFLGICLGMQLLASEGTENGIHAGLDWISGRVERLHPSSAEFRIPHVGWNDIRVKQAGPLFKDLPPQPNFYFVHSYHLACKNRSEIAATCDYGGDFCAAVQYKNIVATQFHPEKSQANGLKFLENFLDWRPSF